MKNKNQTSPSRWARTLSRSLYFLSLLMACMLWTTNTQATTCGSATLITPASLPISGQSVVCGGTNDITYAATAASVKTTGCTSSSYYGGQEALYVFTPTITGVYNISLTGQTFTMIMVTLGCPTTAGSTCVDGIANISSSKNINVTLFAGQTYYIMFDTWPTPNSPCPGTFSMSFVSPPPTTPVPWSESFPSNSLPTGWAQSAFFGPSNTVTALNTGGSSTYYLYKNLWSLATTGSFTTINVGLLAGTEYLSFKYKLANFSSPYLPPAAGSGNFIVAISTNYGVTYTNIATVSNNGLAGWQDVSYSLAAYSGQYVKIRITGNWTSGDYYLGFDDFEIKNPPPCSGTPSGGTASASINPACLGVNFNLSLTGASTGEMGLTYLWERADDAAFSINLSTVGTNETQTTSQTSDKYYRCIVTCTNSGLSDTSTAVLVTTNPDACTCNTYCSSNFTSVSFEYVSNVTFAGINNTSAGNTGGPVNYTGFSGSVERGGTYPLSVTIDPDANDYVYAWIDWNADGDFGDAGETYTLATSTSSAGPHTVNITVPCTATLGSTRMRVMVDWSNATPDPCRSATFGEAEDYCISIGDQTLTPASSVTSDKLNDEICSGGNINLTANGGNLGDGGTWQWYTGSCGGTNVGSGASINVSPGTTTTYYVRGEVCNVATSCASITVTVKTAPPAQAVTMPFTGMPSNACPGTTASLSIPAVSNATMYTWDGPPGTTFDGNASPYTSTSPNAAIVFGTPNTSLYQIGVQAGNACGNSLRKIQKVRYSVSVPSAVNGDATVCPNTSGKVYSIPSASEGATSYQWTITGDASINGSGNSATTSSLSVTIDFGPSWAGGTLCVTAKTSCYTSASKCLAIGLSSGNFGIITGSFTACPNSIEPYSVTAGTGIASYNWTVPTNASVSSGQGTNSVSVFYLPSYSSVGSICVTATSICGVVSPPKCKTVAPSLPSRPASISGISNGLCGSSNVTYSTPIISGVTYNWTVPTGATINSGNGTSSINVNFGTFTNGQICVSSHNTCGTSASRCITVKGAPNTPASITANPATWCAYDAGIDFTANVSNVTGIYTLSWAYPNSTTYVAGGGNTTSLTLDWGASNGVVMVTSSNACGTGTRTYTSNISCREGELSASALNVYPNPTAGMLNVEYTTDKGTAQVTVLDLSGRVVMTQTQPSVEGKNTMQLDLSRVAKGAYMLNVQTQSGNNQVRIVVE